MQLIDDYVHYFNSIDFLGLLQRFTMGGGSSKSRRMYILNDDNYTSMSSDYDAVINKMQRNFRTPELEYIKKINNTTNVDEVHESIGKLVVMRSKSQQVEKKLRSMVPLSPKNEKSLATVSALLRKIRFQVSMLSRRASVRAYSIRLPNIQNNSRVKSQNFDSVMRRTNRLNNRYNVPRIRQVLRYHTERHEEHVIAKT